MKLSQKAFEQLRAALAARRWLEVRGTGASMFPSLRQGDLLRVEAVAVDAIKPGQIVAVHFNQRLVAHRVVNVRRPPGAGPEILGRGDFLLSPVHSMPVEGILGRVVALRRGGRTISLDGPVRCWTARLWARQDSLWSVMRRLLPAAARTWFRNRALLLARRSTIQ